MIVVLAIVWEFCLTKITYLIVFDTFDVKEDILKFAEGLDMLSEQDRQTLVNMTPASYTGKAEQLAELKLK